jgi:hypothetical protein
MLKCAKLLVFATQGLIVTTVLTLVPVCWCGEKAEPAYEPGVITSVSNVGRAVDHWFTMQTECCNYTIQNRNSFSGFKIGGYNDVWIRDSVALIRVGNKVGKARILKAEQRDGFDPSLAVALDQKGNEYRISNTASLPDGWVFVTRDPHNEIHSSHTKELPEGWRLVHGIPGIPLPPVLKQQ